MNNADRCLIAEYDSFPAAVVGLKVLETDGFTSDTVSVVTRGDDPALHELDEMVDRTSDSPPLGKSTGVGGLVGGSLGVALGAMSMVGPLMVAGPLVGLAAGAGTGAALSQTERWGVEEDVIKGYEAKIADGAVLVLIADESMRLDDARRLLKTTDVRGLERFGKP